MSFNIDRLTEVDGLKDEFELLEASATSAVFDWLNDKFDLKYGQIDWDKVEGATTFEIDGLNKGKVLRHLLSLGLTPDDSVLAVWSDCDEGIRLSVRAAFSFYDDLWYPAKEDLWLVTEDHSACIEFHHEGQIGSVLWK